MITFEEFQKAKKIVDEYYSEQMKKEFQKLPFKNICMICQKEFESTRKFEICSTCYV
jgi:hypothetical protein